MAVRGKKWMRAYPLHQLQLALPEKAPPDRADQAGLSILVHSVTKLQFWISLSASDRLNAVGITWPTKAPIVT